MLENTLKLIFYLLIDRKSWKNRYVSNSHVEDASRSFKIQNGDVSVGHIFNKKMRRYGCNLQDCSTKCLS